MSNKLKDQQDKLEEIIDVVGISQTLMLIRDICDLKSIHLEENWQDYTSSKRWEKASKKIENLLGWWWPS